MKKLLALTLTMAMLFTMTAMAEENIIVSGDTTKDVIATYKEGTDGGTIYSVDIVWGSMEFTYNAESRGVWNPDTHEYEKVSASSWTHAEGANVVKITNHSNAELTANITFSSSVDGVSGSFNKNELKLDTAVGTDKDKAPNDSAYLTLDGELPKSEESVVVGNVTMTIENNTVVDSNVSSNEPNILRMNASSKFNNSENYIVSVEGENLDIINQSNFHEYFSIIADVNDRTDVTIPNNNIIYLAETDTSATVTIKQIYFSSAYVDTFQNVRYQLLQEDGQPVYNVN